jgi:hypothetical protein
MMAVSFIFTSLFTSNALWICGILMAYEFIWPILIYTCFIHYQVPSAGIKSSKNMNIMVGRCHAAHDYKHGLSCGRRGLV